MKTWKRYERYLNTGEWHVHTKYTDGKNTVFEVCEKAKELGIPLIAFTEHVRRDLTYDFNDFLDDVERARDEFPELVVLSGVEAKVLPDGSLDVGEDILKQVDYPIFAFHSFPRDRELYLRRLKEAIENKYVNTWAHPGLFLRRTGFHVKTCELRDIFALMRRNDVLLEINRRYNLPKEKWRSVASELGIKTVVGGDVHDTKDLERGSGMTSKTLEGRTR